LNESTTPERGFLNPPQSDRPFLVHDSYKLLLYLHKGPRGLGPQSGQEMFFKYTASGSVETLFVCFFLKIPFMRGLKHTYAYLIKRDRRTILPSVTHSNTRKVLMSDSNDVTFAATDSEVTTLRLDRYAYVTLSGRIAVLRTWMRPIVRDRVAWSVSLLVCPSVTEVSPAKTAELIEMRFGLWARMRAQGWGPFPPMGRGNFDGREKGGPL